MVWRTLLVPFGFVACAREKLYVAVMDAHIESSGVKAGVVGNRMKVALMNLFNDMIEESGAILPDYELVLEPYDDKYNYDTGS